jgi:hypothetical protein
MFSAFLPFLVAPSATPSLLLQVLGLYVWPHRELPHGSYEFVVTTSDSRMDDYSDTYAHADSQVSLICLLQRLPEACSNHEQHGASIHNSHLPHRSSYSWPPTKGRSNTAQTTTDSILRTSHGPHSSMLPLRPALTLAAASLSNYRRTAGRASFGSEGKVRDAAFAQLQHIQGASLARRSSTSRGAITFAEKRGLRYLRQQVSNSRQSIRYSV